ncbi:hypothetical protein M9H77_26751 [Catharanthus roseus]|uniref:Uncharacterized protein n=1 Tax=Catharanthus roseus TaxID=4058 RepID=A0ACC0AAL6_CATRO|nr:hypothetical protein M9H77_26751 [Catharanthus roseus]
MRIWSLGNCASLLSLGFAFFLLYRYPSLSSSSMASEDGPKSIYEFTVKDIRGNDVPLSDYRGKVVLVVNVASKWYPTLLIFSLGPAIPNFFLFFCKPMLGSVKLEQANSWKICISSSWGGGVPTLLAGPVGSVQYLLGSSPPSFFLVNCIQGSPQETLDLYPKIVAGARSLRKILLTGLLSNITNISFCSGLTQSNYKELNVLYEKYKDQGFEILAFPCNQFGWQEPGTNDEIQETVCTRFKAEFPVFDKIDVNGKNAAPLYKFLKSEKGGLITDAIKWNFTKFLVNKEGKVVERYSPRTSPLQIEVVLTENCLSFHVSSLCTRPRTYKTFSHLLELPGFILSYNALDLARELANASCIITSNLCFTITGDKRSGLRFHMADLEPLHLFLVPEIEEQC